MVTVNGGVPPKPEKNGFEKFGNGLLRGSTAGIKGEKTEGWQGTVGDVTGSLAGSMAIGAASSVVGSMQKGGTKSKIAAGLTTAAFSAYSGIRAFNEAPEEATLQQKLIAAGTEAGLTAGSLWVGGKLGQGKLWKTVALNAALDGTSNVISTELSNRIYGRETTTNERLMSFGLGAVMSGGFTYAGQKVTTKSTQTEISNSTPQNPKPVPQQNPEPAPLPESQPVQLTEAQPVTLSESQPVQLTEAQPVTLPESQPVQLTEAQPVTQPNPEPVTQPNPEPVTQPNPEPVTPQPEIVTPQPETVTPQTETVPPPTPLSVGQTLETYRNNTKWAWGQQPFRLIDQVSGDFRMARQVLKEHGQTRNKLPLGEGVKADIALTQKMLGSWGEGLIALATRTKPPRAQKPHEMLGVSRNATEDQINAGFKTLALKLHTDTNGGVIVPNAPTLDQLTQAKKAMLDRLPKAKPAKPVETVTPQKAEDLEAQPSTSDNIPISQERTTRTESSYNPQKTKFMVREFNLTTKQMVKQTEYKPDRKTKVEEYEYDPATGNRIKQTYYDHNNGTMSKMVEYDPATDYELKRTAYRNDGTMSAMLEVDPATGNWIKETLYNEDETISSMRECDRSNGRILKTEYRKNGTMSAMIEYDLDTGKKILDTGKKIKETIYNNDETISSVKEFDTGGGLVKKTTYNENRTYSVQENDHRGRTLKKTEYRSNGTMSAMREYYPGTKRKSTDTFYNDDGTISSVIE